MARNGAIWRHHKKTTMKSDGAIWRHIGLHRTSSDFIGVHRSSSEFIGVDQITIMAPYGAISDFIGLHRSLSEFQTPISISEKLLRYSDATISEFGTPINSDMAPYGAIWRHMAPSQKRAKMVMAPYGAIWRHVAPYGAIWRHMAPFYELEKSKFRALRLKKCLRYPGVQLVFHVIYLLRCIFSCPFSLHYGGQVPPFSSTHFSWCIRLGLCVCLASLP